MSSLAIESSGFPNPTSYVTSLLSPKELYRRASQPKSRIPAEFNLPQEVFANVEQQNVAPPRSIDTGGTTYHVKSVWKPRVEAPEISDFEARFHANLPSSDHSRYRAFIVAIERSIGEQKAENWNHLFAYTDFDSLPTYVSLLTLAATADQSANVPARRIFFERCRRAVKSMGLNLELVDHFPSAPCSEVEKTGIITTAHMVACLEEASATEGYLDAAIKFEQRQEIRSGLACIYRNVRFRLRDHQLELLDEDINEFNFKSAGIDTMLSILTATAPQKRVLRNRSKLFKEIRSELKRRGQLERGLLDGLK
jgi:hypothetical protein